MSDADTTREIAFALIDKGFDLRLRDGVMSVAAADGTVVRLDVDSASALTAADEEEVYWANYYAHARIAPASPFQTAVSERPDLPHNVVDIGCGDGRDTFAFGRDGRRVLGLDRSHVGIAHAQRHAREIGLDQVTFEACDVGEATSLAALLTGAQRTDEPTLFYARFLLHSLPADVQHTLMSTIAKVARSGDQFAAEFRTVGDEFRHKVFTDHYRRFQDGPEFGRRLADEFGFTVLDEREGTGLSPHGDEDPVVYRVIAQR